MEITLNHLDAYEKELLLTIPWEAVAQEYNDLLKRYAHLPVRGFRPGKVPPAVTMSSFKTQIEADFLAMTSTRFFRKALEQHGLEAATPIEILESDVRKGEQLHLRATFIAMPEFDLPDYTRLQLQATDPAEVLDEISMRLLERTSLDLPPALIEKELKYSELAGEVPNSQECEQAYQRAKLMLILKKIARQDALEPSEFELTQRLDAIAADNGITTAELKAFLQSNHGLARLRDSLLAETVLNYLASVQQPG